MATMVMTWYLKELIRAKNKKREYNILVSFLLDKGYLWDDRRKDLYYNNFWREIDSQRS